jgi:hypothetical protein
MAVQGSKFNYSSGRRYGRAPRVFQVLRDGSVRVGVATQVVIAEETVVTFENMDAFISAMGGTTAEPKRKLKRRRV